MELDVSKPISWCSEKVHYSFFYSYVLCYFFLIVSYRDFTVSNFFPFMAAIADIYIPMY